MKAPLAPRRVRITSTKQAMSVDPRAGQLPDPAMLLDVPRLLAAYRDRAPDPTDPAQRVTFGTSGHRGTAFDGSFNDAHIAAITQAICEYRAQQGTDGPVYLGIDTHALSRPAADTALQVLAANGVHVMLDDAGGFTPTPVVSHAILRHNGNGGHAGIADGIVVTPSHNPPEDGGFKYNAPHGGPADSTATNWIQGRANALLEAGLAGVRRIALAEAQRADTTHRHDYLTAYVEDLGGVIDFDTIRAASPSMAVDPLGGAGVTYWPRIAERWRIPLEVLGTGVDPTFSFMALDWDGRIRMDPSSKWAMQPLLAKQGRFDVLWACDNDHDRHGIVTRTGGLLPPNHFLAACIQWLFTHRPEWPVGVGVGKTVVSSAMIDCVVASLARPLMEVPVGFKWFVDGLSRGALGFVGEESAGATLLRRDGTVWTTDKDGIVLGLLAAEITAGGRDPAQLYASLVERFGDPATARVDAHATAAQKAVLSALSARDVVATTLAGEPITRVLTRAPGNDAPIGGLKVETSSGWFAARPSGTEDVYKLYAESFRGPEHLAHIQGEGRAIVDAAFAAAGAGGVP